MQDPHAADTGGVGLSANAFADVYRDHLPELTRYCRSILRDGHDAEDAAQTAMERAFSALSTGPAPDRLRPWLFTIAQRESLNVLRRRGHRETTGLDESVAASGPSPEEAAAIRERLAQLLGDLRELAPRQRELLVARELGGRSYRDLARDFGTSEAGAQQTVLEARQSLLHFERGRSLACDDVQEWLSARDHVRVRTRRVRAHLRDCECCRTFQLSIRSRRRELALLLPGVGGAAWWAPVAALLGQGSVKALTAGAVVLTGVTLTGVGAPRDAGGEQAPRAAAVAAAATSWTGTTPLTARLQGATKPARVSALRRGPVRTSARPSVTGTRRAGLPARTPQPAANARAAAEVAPGATTPAPRPKPAHAEPVDAPGSSGAGPAPPPAPLPVLDDVRALAEPLLDAVPDITGPVGELTDALTDATSVVDGMRVP